MLVADRSASGRANRSRPCPAIFPRNPAADPGGAARTAQPGRRPAPAPRPV